MPMKRTDQQRKSIEVYCRNVANAMNDAGESVQTVFTAPVDLSQENVKEGMFKVIMTALYPDIKSTTDLDTKQVTEVFENMNRILAERYMISVDWPSQDSLYQEAMHRFSKP
jgi:hypothetical protein